MADLAAVHAVQAEAHAEDFQAVQEVQVAVASVEVQVASAADIAVAVSMADIIPHPHQDIITDHFSMVTVTTAEVVIITIIMEVAEFYPLSSHSLSF